MKTIALKESSVALKYNSEMLLLVLGTLGLIAIIASGIYHLYYTHLHYGYAWFIFLGFFAFFVMIRKILNLKAERVLHKLTAGEEIIFNEREVLISIALLSEATTEGLVKKKAPYLQIFYYDISEVQLTKTSPHSIALRLKDIEEPIKIRRDLLKGLESSIMNEIGLRRLYSLNCSISAREDDIA
jgi:hypothetical protein